MANRTVTLKAPASWPFSTPVVPRSFVPSKINYKPDGNGLINAKYADVGILLGFGFYLYGTSSGPLSSLSDVADDVAAEDDVLTFKNGKYRPQPAPGGGGDSLVKLWLTADQHSFNGTDFVAGGIITLHSAPIMVIEAPGAGKFILPTRVVPDYEFGTAAFLAPPGSSQNIGFTTVADGSLNDSSMGIIATATVDSVVPNTPSLAYRAKSDVVNKALYLNASNRDLDAESNPTFSIKTPGTGYLLNDLFKIQDNYDAFKVTAIDGGGGVTGLDFVADPSAIFSVENDVAPGFDEPGSGTGFTLDITEVHPGDGTATVWIYYQVFDLNA